MKISNINFALTTHCNRSCPECAMNCPNIKGSFITWDEIYNTVPYFKGIDTITLTGGEATMHPNFAEWVPLLKPLFGCNYLDLETNGYGFNKISGEIFDYFDQIYISDYGDNLIKSPGKKKPIVFNLKGGHIPRTHRDKGTCFRGSYKKVLFCEGLLYRCSTGSGNPNAKGIKLTDNWIERIEAEPLNCKNCLFAESE